MRYLQMDLLQEVQAKIFSGMPWTIPTRQVLLFLRHVLRMSQVISLTIFMLSTLVTELMLTMFSDHEAHFLMN